MPMAAKKRDVCAPLALSWFPALKSLAVARPPPPLASSFILRLATETPGLEEFGTGADIVTFAPLPSAHCCWPSYATSVSRCASAPRPTSACAPRWTPL